MSSVCVVVPCFDEAQRLQPSEWLRFLETHPDVAFCFVDDGSTDGTRALLEGLRAGCPSRVEVLVLPANVGKAAAVRAGILHGVGMNAAPILGYWDADLSTPLDEIEHLLAAFDANPLCMLSIGSRVKRLGARIERQTTRHVMGRIFATCARGLLGFSVYDSQCGAKLFRIDLARMLFADPFLTRWLFDLELLARLRNMRGGQAFEEMTEEVPLRQWRDVAGSKLKLSDLLAVPRELFRLRAHYNRESAARPPRLR